MEWFFENILKPHLKIATKKANKKLTNLTGIIWNYRYFERKARFDMLTQND